MLFIAVLCTEGSHTTSNILSSNLMSSLHLVADQAENQSENESLFIARCVYSLLRWIRRTESASSSLCWKTREREYFPL